MSDNGIREEDIDHQCGECNRVFHGDQTLSRPGRQIGSAEYKRETGRELSHGQCPEGTACYERKHRKMMKEYYKRRTGQ